MKNRTCMGFTLADLERKLLIVCPLDPPKTGGKSNP
jgi:hypothetical protein